MKTAIEWLEDIIYGTDDFVLHEVIKQAKEMEKDEVCYFGARCCIMTTQKKEWSLDELYNEIYKNTEE